MQGVILFYFLFVNLLAFGIYGVDKYKSLKQKERISERELHVFSLIGGFFGASLAMGLFSHKISKNSFLIKHIVIILLWIGVIVYSFFNLGGANLSF